MGYSPERKTAALKRMLAPDNMAIRRLSQEEGISEATLHKWRAETRGKGQLLPDADAGPAGWSSRDKFAAVLKTAAMNETDLAKYRRKRGLFPAQIKAWRGACRRTRHGKVFLKAARATGSDLGCCGRDRQPPKTQRRQLLADAALLRDNAGPGSNSVLQILAPPAHPVGTSLYPSGKRGQLLR